MSSAITLYFCYDTSAHDCISQGKKPPKVTGVKTDRDIAKILRAFCRSSELDDGIDKLQLGRCYCQSDKNNTQRSTATFGPQDQVQRTGLGDGDRIFVRRIQNQVQDHEMAESGEEIEEDDEEFQDEDEDEDEDGGRGLKGEFDSEHHKQNKSRTNLRIQVTARHSQLGEWQQWIDCCLSRCLHFLSSPSVSFHSHSEECPTCHLQTVQSGRLVHFRKGFWTPI